MSILARERPRKPGASLVALAIAAGLGLQSPDAARAASPQAGADEAQQIQVPAGALDKALLALAAQTGQQLLYRPELVAGRRTAGLSGRYSAAEAAARLVADPNLVVVRVGPNALALKRRATPSAPAGADPRPFVAEPNAPIATIPSGAAAPPSPAQATTVAAIEVTGSHIRGAPLASPLTVLTRQDIERSGQTTVADALKALPQNFAAGAAPGNESTGGDRTGRNGGFGTGINLRGLGNNATLVLVNGRRVGGSGDFGDFTDVSMIPTAAVERVEVLLDGASAVYGSDAVGGVVNIILRRHFEGAETRLLTGAATGGGALEGQIAQTFGHRWSDGGVLLSVEADRRGALNGADRPFADNADLRPLGGSDQRLVTSFPGNILILNPATGVSSPAYAIPGGQNGVGLLPGQLIPGTVNRWNQRYGYDLLPRQTTASVYLAADQDVGERLTLTADARYAYRAFQLQQGVPLSQLTVTRANPFYVSPIGAASESIAYAFADLPFPVQSGNVQTFSATAGGTLTLPAGWRAESYAAFGQETDVARTAGNLNSTNVNEALGTIPDQAGTSFSTAVDGFYNPFAGVVGANSPAVLAFIGSGSTYAHTTDRVYSANLQADGPLWRLPAGALKLAIGANVRHETFARDGYNFVSGVTPTPIASADAARNVAAAFAEVQVPIFGPDNRHPGFERLDLSASGRVEHYEAIGTTANPKVGLLWSPVSDLQLRATYGTSFRAPALRELDGPASYTPALLALGADRVRVLQLGGGNPELKPETAVSWTVGADYRPAYWPGVSLNATYFDISYRNRIAQPVLQNLAGALTDPTLVNYISRIAPGVNAADLARITALLASPALSTAGGVFPPSAYGAIVDARYVNTAALRVRGLDLGGAWRRPIGHDELTLSVNSTYLFDYDQQLTPTAPLVDKVGIVGFPVRLKGRAAADWTHGPYAAEVAVNYTGAYKSPLGARIDPDATVDLRLAWTGLAAEGGRGLTLAINVRNLFDSDPPFYDNPAGVGYDPNNGDPIGRYVFLQLTRAW
jgi:outer membrane receptor protein involved in Fe transport